MPELKHNFTQGKMNKDVDERLVPDGQYRDATNIQVSTSDGSDVGSAQTLLGNTLKNTMVDDSGVYSVPTTATCVGSISVPNRDKIYYFVSAGDRNDSNAFLPTRRDYVMEYDAVLDAFKYVFVDIYRVETQISEATTAQSLIKVPAPENTTGNLSGIRVGMRATGTLGGSQLNNAIVHDVYREEGTNNIIVHLTSNGNDIVVSPDVNDNITFRADRVLNFNKNNLITAINVVDGFIYWTDNAFEPKKLNIARSIAGTGGTTHLQGGTSTISLYDNNQQPTLDIFLGDTHFFHTRVVVDKLYYSSDVDRYRVKTSPDNKRAVYAEEENATVIKKAPTQPLKLIMSRDAAVRVNDDGEINDSFITTEPISWVNPETGEVYQVGDTVTISFVAPGVDYRVNDVIILANQDSTSNADTFNDYSVKIRITSTPGGENPNDLFQGPFEAEILFISEGLDLSETSYYSRIEDIDPLFEFKFVRFSYRYKYQDGEYSTFAPWSQVAFLPDTYEYYPKKGYNLGMVNQLRSLTLEYYHHREDIIPSDVVEIDLLYKETNNAAVYNVKTVKKSDDDPFWPDLQNGIGDRRGEYTLTTDLIHSILPANQLLRPWDNVPRKALAQEISANRLIYGNYLQNYTVLKDPILELGVQSDTLTSLDTDFALPSVKSVRSYQVGVVYSDGYGRETPVLTSKDARVRVDKNFCFTRNRIKARIRAKHEVPSWAKYYSFYIKEPTVEYYTMAMDRWYKAEDENIWLSFPSSERNKLMEEDFLILKKAHGNDTPVTEKARYRVLAIENEAPEFIRTMRRSMGVMFNEPQGDEPNASIGNETRGYPLQDTNFITINGAVWRTTFGDTSEWIRTPDKFTIRFYGPAGEVSEEYEVIKLSLLDSSGDAPPDVKLKIDGKFEEDVAFASTEDTWATRIDGLVLELIEHKVINKPEYDGRFFVKIHRDTVLEEYVLNNGDVDYTVQASWGLRYLNNNGYSNAGTALGAGYGEIPVDARERPHGASTTNFPFANALVTSPTADSTAYNLNAAGGAAIANGNIFQNDCWSRHPTMRPHHAVYFWDGATNPPAGGSNSPGYIQNKHIHKSPNVALNDETITPALNAGSNANLFWTQMAGYQDFFIDGATAYSWTSKAEDGWNSPQDTPGNLFWEDDIWVNALENIPDILSQIINVLSLGVLGSLKKSHAWEVRASGGAFQVDAGGAPAFGGVDHQPGASRLKSGLPSRGVWGGGKYMDISWTGMGIGWSGTGWGDNAPYPHTLSAVPGSTFEGASQFIGALTTPGTRWRFRNDPEEITYVTEDWNFAANMPYGYGSPYYEPGVNRASGVFGIRNFRTGPQLVWPGISAINSILGSGEAKNKAQYKGHNMRQRWTIAVTDEQWRGAGCYCPTRGTIQGAETTVPPLHHDATDMDVIEILMPTLDDTGKAHFSNNPAVWETEPRESADIDIYYQASPLIPIHLESDTNEEYIPIGSTFVLPNQPGETQGTSFAESTYTVTGWNDKTISFTPSIPQGYILSDNMSITFTKNLYYSFTATINIGDGAEVSSSGNMTSLDLNYSGTVGVEQQRLLLPYQMHILDWNNCWCFGNGVESDRIRDDFNAPQMDNGVKASSVLEGQSREERRKHGLVWSGIYNSNSGVNNTNQFIQAESITKDLNPIYGSIQKLYSRNTQLLLFCEDKVLRAVTNRDALYNADGNPQLVASNAVVGDVQPYKGDYGIATFPESFAASAGRIFFADAMRGKVLVLQGDGISSISGKGMKDYFATTILSDYSTISRCLGTYDTRKNEYNISVYKKFMPSDLFYRYQETVSFAELSDGWVSFKSFYPESGCSINNNYFTFNGGQLWKHHDNEVRNSFYGGRANSDLTVVFNDNPGSVKSFNTVNYEGSQARVTNFDTETTTNWLTGDYSTADGLTTNMVTDGEYYNLGGPGADASGVNGWYVESIMTNLQSTGEIELIEKENKWFGKIIGDTTNIDNLDENEFSVQGLGTATLTHSDDTSGETTAEQIKLYVSNSSAAGLAYGNPDWDTSADNFTVTTNSLATTAGATISNQTVELTMSPPANAFINAAGCSIGNATEISENGVPTSGTGIWQGGNVDAGITRVKFENNNTVIDGNNTVKVTVTLDGFTAPLSDNTYYIDIDTTPGAVETAVGRAVCVDVAWDYFYNGISSTMFVDTSYVHPNLSISDASYNDLPLPANWVNEGTAQQHFTTGNYNADAPQVNFGVPEGESTTLVTYEFTAGSNNYFEAPATAALFHMQGEVLTTIMYIAQFDFETHSHVYNVGGQLTGFKMDINYSPPLPYGQGGVWVAAYPDPEDFCSLQLRIEMDYNLIMLGS